MKNAMIDNFLSSGHSFSAKDNLQKFRFSLLNKCVLVASIFTFNFYFASIFNLKGIKFSTFHENACLFYALVCFFAIFPLRIDKKYYKLVSNVVVLSSLILFYSGLLTTNNEDEFRLVWFFLVVLASFVLVGKRYGLVLMVLVLLSLILINMYVDLNYSTIAKFTFFNSFLIFTAFSYSFLNRIEQDEREYGQQNNQLIEKVKTEVELREQQEQMLLQQYRMANMGGMINAIAHQWRQPLMNVNAILMNMEYLIDAKKDTRADFSQKIAEITMLTEHMSRTIEDFRGLMTVEKTQSLVTVNETVNEVLMLMKNSLNDINVNCNIKSSSAFMGYKSEIMQVIIILLSNAIGILEQRQIERKIIEINCHVANELVIVEIQDNAGGIDEANIAMVFDPYFTTKEQLGGTGLGLYIAKIIIEQRMSGEIIASNMNDGAKFSLYLPSS